MENLNHKENNEIEKIKVTSAEIIASGNADKPYFEIKYYPLDTGECCVGYGSYELKFVFEWLKECFDVVNLIEGNEYTINLNTSLIDDIYSFTGILNKIYKDKIEFMNINNMDPDVFILINKNTIKSIKEEK